MTYDTEREENKQGSSDEAQYKSSVYKANKLEEQFAQEVIDLPHGFRLIDGKIYFEKPSKKEGDEPTLQYVCSELRVAAYVRDGKKENHGRLVSFPDPEGNMHELIVPADLLAGDSTALRALLLNQGMRLGNDRNARQLLADLILQSSPKRKIFCTDQTGWNRNVFVLPSEVIGKEDEEDVRLLNSSMSPNRSSVAGTIDTWKENVARYCFKNSRLIFSVSAAFAPPLLDLVKVESGGIHTRGASSIGKTSLLKVANSVWNGPQSLRTWRSTSNGLEAIATEHNDCLLCLDELDET